VTRLYCHAGGSGVTRLTHEICDGRPLPSAPERGNVTHLVTPMHVARQHVFVTPRGLARPNELDLFMNGAIFEKSGGANQRKVNKDEWVKPKPGTYVTRLARNSGALDCRPGKPC